jgi:hypothetical protein
VTLFQNPVFLTRKRLVHRAGVLAAVSITALVGLGLLAGLLYCFVKPGLFHFSSAREAGKLFYGWLVGVEAALLIGGGFNRISRVLAEDRRAGLWDSNRLTPLRPSELVIGYWFGSALREFYMSAVLAVLGLAVVAVAGLSFGLWAGSQILLVSTALFFGLLALVIGTAWQSSQLAAPLFLALLLAQLPGFLQPRFMVTNFLLPVYPIVHLFSPEEPWRDFPEFFGCPIPPLIYSLGLQLTIGWFLWRAVERKTTNPARPLLRHRDAVGLFSVILVAQHGLIWNLWRGRFGSEVLASNEVSLLPIIQGETLLTGAVVLLLAGAHPEWIRVEALRAGSGAAWRRFCRHNATTVFALAAGGALALLTQCARSLSVCWQAYLIAVGNLLACFVSLFFLLEFCRLRFRRRARGAFVLGLFVLCLLPVIMAGVFSSPALFRLSFLVPGILALSGPAGGGFKPLFLATALQLLIAVTFFLLWRSRWRRLLPPEVLPPAAQTRPVIQN